MASSGNFKSSTTYAAGTGYGRYLYVTWSSTQSVANNTSTISWTLYSKNPDGIYEGRYVYGYNINFTAGGSARYTNSSRACYDNETISSGSFTVNHNSDGTGSFKWSISANFYTGGSANSTGSGTITLPTIARASTVSVSPSSVDCGSSTTISVTRASSSFTHNIYVYVDNVKKKTISSVGTSTTFTPDYDTYATLKPNGTSVSAKIYCQTYSGSTKIGDQTSCSLAINIPENSSTKPTISQAITTTNTFHGLLLQNVSQISSTITASGNYGATISSYAHTLAGTSFGTLATNSATVTSSGTNTVKASVTDSREYSNSTESTVTVTEYYRPSLSNIASVRANSSGVATTDGTWLSTTFTTNSKSLIVSSVEENSPTVTVKWKKKSDSTWGSVSLYSDLASITDKSKTYTVTSDTTLNNGIYYWDDDTDVWVKESITSGDCINANLDTNYTYDLVYTIQDIVGTTFSLASASYSDMVSTSFTLMDWAKYGKSMAIGKVSEADSLGEDSCLEIGIPTYCYNGIYIKKALDNSFIDILSAYNNLFYSSGDTLTISSYAADGYTTTSKTNFRVTIVTPKSMANITTITLSAGNVMIRQNGNYLHSTSTATSLSSLGTIYVTKTSDNTMLLRLVVPTADSNTTNNDTVSLSLSDLTFSFT